MTSANRAEIDAEAWRWVLRMDAPDWGEADEADLQTWIEGHERRAGALLEAEAMWEALGNIRITDTKSDVETDFDHSEDVHLRPQTNRRGVLAVGAAAIAASFAGAMFFFNSSERYETQIGEIRRVPLADGSTAAINTGSKIEVSLADTKREVRLDHGEAWFQVAKDRSRPFVVEAGRIRVLAVGTAFSVRRLDNGADILVTEGVVEAWADGAEGNKVKIGAGQRAFVADNSGIVKPPATLASVDRTLAWRSGKIDFVNQPIVEAVAEFNRYNHRQLVLLDPAIGQEKFDGVFRTDDPEGFAQAVRNSLGVPVNLGNPTAITIGRAR